MKDRLLVVFFVVTTTYADVLRIDKGVIVHLFEWKYSDIAQECENFLAPNGFAGVQISPPSENIVIDQPKRPWWERYQPISYKLVSRSGSEKDLQDMLDRCNKVNIRIFADVVLNHMTGPGQSAVGVAGSQAKPDDYSYPAVNFTSHCFHQPTCSLNNYKNATEIRDCELLGLRDLNNSDETVRHKQVEYLDKLIKMGVAGFRVDAARHMWPADLKYIYGKLESLSTQHGFPANTKPLIYQEVIDMGGEAVTYQEYSPLGLVTDFRYGKELGRSFQGQSDLVYLKNFGSAWNLLPDDVGVVFIENHDTQRGSDSTILNYKKFRPYKMAIAFMLAFPYGSPKLLSSYYFDNFDQGPPHDNNYNTLSPQPSKDNICANGWACEHRWRQIYNMVRFHNTVKGTKVTNWWDNGKNQIAFCRGNKGFVAFNMETSIALDQKLQTCLPKGKYCDIISGNLVNNACTGKTVEVGDDGTAQVFINAFHMNDPNLEKDGVLALDVKDVISDGKKSTGENTGDKTPTLSDDPNADIGHSSAQGSSKPSNEESKKLPSSNSEESKVASSSSGSSGADSSKGKNSLCEKLLKLAESKGKTSTSPCSSSLISNPDDLSLLVAVARVRRMERLNDLLSII